MQKKKVAAYFPPKFKNRKQKSKNQKLSKYVFIGILIVVSLAFFNMVQIFLVPVLLAATFSTLLYPLYTKILKKLNFRKNLSALLTCLIIIVGIFIPLTLVANLVVNQALSVYEISEPFVKKVMEEGGLENAFESFEQSEIYKAFKLGDVDFKGILVSGLKTIGTFLSKFINKTSGGVIEFAATIVLMLYTMFYFFRDGAILIKEIRYLSPLKPEYEEKIISRFTLVSRATVKGTLLIGLTQGTLGAIALLIFGIETWVLWGVVMVVLSVIPMVGAWLVMLPIAIVQFFLGDVVSAIGIFLSSTLIISNIDNLIRPRLVGEDAKLHDLMIFFSTIGGIGIFGIMGFIVGPVLAALFVTVVEIYRLEFKDELLVSQKNQSVD